MVNHLVAFDWMTVSLTPVMLVALLSRSLILDMQNIMVLQSLRVAFGRIEVRINQKELYRKDHHLSGSSLLPGEFFLIPPRIPPLNKGFCGSVNPLHNMKDFSSNPFDWQLTFLSNSSGAYGPHREAEPAESGIKF
ncbi:MAG: hypothetical protein ACYCOO_09035 [Chitinophagaceae bacterium]